MRTFAFGAARALWTLALAVGSGLGQVALAQQAIPFERIAPPMPPRIVVPEARVPIRLQRVSVQAEVLGRAAQTRVELVFFNPNDRQLEGELQFPLRDGQVVTGFALDINGELREAVPVEKARGQEVFEEITRRRVDPALMEQTQGNNYKLRIYPLPAHGTRRVVLSIGETLGQPRFELPLAFGGAVGRLEVDVRVPGVAARGLNPRLQGLPEQALGIAQRSDGTHVELRSDGFAGTARLSLALPASNEVLAATQTLGTQTYVYAELPVPMPSAPRPAPRRLALLWDASGSGAQRDHGRELMLLEAYLKALRNVEVTLVVARDSAEAPRSFSVKDGRWDALRRTLETMVYDGASNLGALVPPAGSDLALLFSDGLGNWGGPAAATSEVPLYALSAAASLDAGRLRALSQAHGGDWLDLLALPTAEAVKALQIRKARLIGLRSDAARQLVAASRYADQGRLAIAGLSADSRIALTLELEGPDGRRWTHTATLAPQPGSTLAAQQWGHLRIAELQADEDGHRAEIRRIGKALGLLTRETSLIVLDTAADYARYEIDPPASLRAEVERLRQQTATMQSRSRAAHLDELAARFKAREEWWSQEFPKTDKPMIARLLGQRANDDGSPKLERERQAMPPAAMPAPVAAAPAPAPALAAERRAVASDAMKLSLNESAQSGAAAAPASTIQLTPWAPDSAYARRLREASREQVYQRYLDERPDFANSTGFYLDAADVLFDKGLPELGLRVLSNLVEMNLENRQILRVLGYRLLQAKQPRLAIPVFEAVLRLAPNEPQSYRDLGLAHAEAGQWQPAVDRLWDVASRAWDARFPDIDLIALAELNAIVAQAEAQGTPVQTRAIDPRLLHNLPLDLRIVLAWDADNTDIDLWVVDPNGESTYFGHPLSRQGGRITRDATGGYGPEEFALRQAKPGTYTVKAKFYGHRQQVLASATTVMLRLTLGFGTPQQKDERVTMRLDGAGDMVTVGTFDVRR